MSVLKHSNDLRVTLGASGTFTLRMPGRTLMSIVMAADEASVEVHTVSITQYTAGTDLGNTGWAVDTHPTIEERAKERGIDHDIRRSPGRDLRGGV